MSAVHHYVPQFYLKCFAENPKKPKVWAYQRNEKPFNPSVRNIAGETGFYKFIDSRTGKESDELEQTFSTIETLAGEIIDKLEKPGKLKLNQEDHGNLMYFVGSLHVRGIAHRLKQTNLMNAFSKVEMQVKAANRDSFIDDLKAVGVYATDERAEELRQFVLSGEYNVKYNPRDSFFLKQSMELMQESYKVLVHKDVYLSLNKLDRELVTSDNPVSIFDAKNLPPHINGGLQNGIIVLPIAPDKCLVIKNKGSVAPEKYIDDGLLEDINGRTMFNAYKFIFSKTKSEEVEKIFNRTKPGLGQAVQLSGPFGVGIYKEE